MANQTVIPSPSKLSIRSLLNTSTAHPGIVRPSATRMLISSIQKPPFDIACVNLTGAAGVAHVPDPHAYLSQAHSALTVECLIYPTFNPASLPESFGFILMTSDGAAFRGFQFYFQQSDGSLNFRFTDESNNLQTVTASSASHGITAGKWYHVAATFDGQVEKLYVNGNPVATNRLAASHTISWGIANLNMSAYALGTGTAYQWRARSYLSEVRIWAEARPQAALVKDMFTSLSSPLTRPTLVGYWQLNDTTTTLVDSSLSGENGTLDSGTRTIFLYRPLKRNVQLINTQRPRTVGVLNKVARNFITLSVPTQKVNRAVNATRAVIHLSVPTQTVKTNQIIKPTRSVINLSAQTQKINQTIHPTRAVIHLSANSVKVNRTQHPSRAVIHLSAIAPKSVGITKVYPSRATISITAHAPKAVGITKVYPSSTTIHLSAKAPKTVGISRVYATRATINLLAKGPKINRVQKPSPNSIHIAVSPPTNRLTQHVSRAVIHLSIPPPKLNQNVKPTRCIIHLSVPTQFPIFNQIIRPTKSTIHLSVPNTIAQSIIIHYKFSVKIKLARNFTVIIPIKD